MMKNNMMKKAIATLAILGTISTLNFATIVFAADEIPVNPEPEEMVIIGDDDDYPDRPIFGEFPMSGNHLRWEKIEWYDTYDEAAAHFDFKVGDHAEYKVFWLPIKGWCTHGCTITGRGIYYENGKHAPIYKNDYDGEWYFRVEYE